MVRLKSLEQKAFFATLVIATLALIYLLRDFLQPIFWAALLATLFRPVHQRFTRRLKEYPSTSAAVVVILIICAVILPLGVLTAAVVHQSTVTFNGVTQGEKMNPAEQFARVQKATRPARNWLDRFGIDSGRIESGLSSAMIAASKFIATHAVGWGQHALLFVVQFMAMLYLLFFFIRDGAVIIERLIYILPMGDARERRLIFKFAQMVNATIKGTLVVAVVQGTLGGLAFWMLGVPAPVVWGLVMTVLCLVPVFGAFLVWGPAAIWLATTGETTKAIGLVVLGVFLIGLVDNLLRPILVGRDTRLPDYVILVATLGGIAALGVSGFVIGPILAALCFAGWKMFADEVQASL